jgi:hypothetical protein
VTCSLLRNKEESYDILDFKEADPVLKKHRKDVIEKFMEYELVVLHDFKDEGKHLDDYNDYVKKK